MQTLNANPDAKSHPLDDFCRRMAVRFKALGWTGTDHGMVAGNFACLANATQTSRGGHGVYIDTSPLSRLIYKGSQISIRTGSMPKWILQRFSCSFARYSAEALDELQLDWAPAYFGKETLCDALREPREARSRIKHVFAEPLPAKSVVVVCVSGPDFQREFLARGKYVGAVFDGAGLDATDKSLPSAIVPRGRPAPAGYFDRFEEAHPVAALLYGALDGFGQIRKIKRKASPKSPAVHEYNQLVVPLNVHCDMASGFTDVAKGVEYGVFTVDADDVWTFHGSKDTLENICKWPASLPLARALTEKTGVSNFSEIRLAPAKPMEIVNDGSRSKRCMPVDALTTATDGAKRIKTKTEGKPSKKLRCLAPECSTGGKEFNYRGSKDKAYLEAASGNYNCPKCGSTSFFKCVGPGW